MKQKLSEIKAKSNSKGVQKVNNKNNKKPKKTLKEASLPVVVGKTRNNVKNSTKCQKPKTNLKKKKQVEDSDIGEDSGADLEAEKIVSGVNVESDKEDSSSEEQSEKKVSNDDNEEESAENDNSANGDDESNDDDEDADEDKDCDDGAIAEDANDVENDKDSEDDDAPVEVPIPKKPKVKTEMKDNETILVSNLPKKVFKKALEEEFSKYGTIKAIKIHLHRNGNQAFINYEKAEEASAALAANKTEFNGSTICVTLKSESKLEPTVGSAENIKRLEEKKDCIVYVKNLHLGATDNDIRKHFSECGDIDMVKSYPKKGYMFAFVHFAKPESCQAALKLHNSILKGRHIPVYLSDNKHARDPQRIIIVKNPQQLQTTSAETMEKVFGKCGEIEDVEILCNYNVLAIITFKNEESAKKAMTLNGTTEDGFQIEVGPFRTETKAQERTTKEPNTKIYLQNIKPGLKEKDLLEFFANSGEIACITLGGHFAVVKFKDTDGFCKAFLLNETLLRGQPVFLQPYSEIKSRFSKKRFVADNRKRPFPQKRFNQDYKKPRLMSKT